MRVKCKDGNVVDFNKLREEYTFLESDPFCDYSKVLKALNLLPMEEKYLVILYVEMGSHERVARVYNCSRTTIQRRTADVLQKLRNLLT